MPLLVCSVFQILLGNFSTHIKLLDLGLFQLETDVAGIRDDVSKLGDEVLTMMMMMMIPIKGGEI